MKKKKSLIVPKKTYSEVMAPLFMRSLSDSAVFACLCARSEPGAAFLRSRRLRFCAAARIAFRLTGKSAAGGGSFAGATAAALAAAPPPTSPSSPGAARLQLEMTLTPFAP